MRLPPQRDWWTGRVDAADGEAGMRWHQAIQFDQAADIALLGLASDEGVRRNQGRVGAATGPQALRKSLSNLPIHQPLTLCDLGDVACEGEALEKAQREYADLAAPAIGRSLVIGMGGGHEIAWASYQAVRKAMPEAQIGILNFDAHFDLRKEPRPTSGTSFWDAINHKPGLTQYMVCGISASSNTAALYETAESDLVSYLHDDSMTVAHLKEAWIFIEEWLEGIDVLYMTVCLDVFPAYAAPGVSAPASGGVGVEVIELLIEQAAQSGKLVMADIAELNPSLDIDNRTARLAARLVWRIANAWKSIQE